jgi:hypothetical protein
VVADWKNTKKYFVNFISSHFLKYEQAVGHKPELAEVIHVIFENLRLFKK